MQRLKNNSVCPPDGFRYTHETGYVSRAIDPYNWMLDIIKHRKANGLSVITLEDAEDQLCRQLEPQNCEYDATETGSRGWVNTRLKFSDILEGSKAYIELIASGFKTVSQEEADRRAKICSGCYLRIEPQGCGACTKIATIITGFIAGKKTKYEDHLANKACAVCSCPVTSLVHFPMSILDKADSAEKQSDYPEFCWRKESGTNYLKEADSGLD